MLIINSVKCSVKIPETNLKFIRSICEERSLKYCMHNNFIVIRYSSYTFTIFKKAQVIKKNKTLPSRQHANFTTPNVYSIPCAVDLLCKILALVQEDKSTLLPSIDNLSASFTLGRCIDLLAFLEHNIDAYDCISYNPETFPGLFFKIENSSSKCILFKSGKVIIVGTRSEKQLKEVYQSMIVKCVNI